MMDLLLETIRDDLQAELDRRHGQFYRVRTTDAGLKCTLLNHIKHSDGPLRPLHYDLDVGVTHFGDEYRAYITGHINMYRKWHPADADSLAPFVACLADNINIEYGRFIDKVLLYGLQMHGFNGNAVHFQFKELAKVAADKGIVASLPQQISLKHKVDDRSLRIKFAVSDGAIPYAFTTDIDGWYRTRLTIYRHGKRFISRRDWIDAYQEFHGQVFGHWGRLISKNC